MSRITVTPTNSHNATLMFLYENGAPIPDADGALVGHQVELGNGVTTIVVKVLSPGRRSVPYLPYSGKPGWQPPGCSGHSRSHHTGRGIPDGFLDRTARRDGHHFL